MRARGSGGCDEDENDDDGGGGATYCPRIHSLFQFKLKPQKKRRALTRRRERAHAHSPREGWVSPPALRRRPSRLRPGYRSFSSTSCERTADSIGP